MNKNEQEIEALIRLQNTLLTLPDKIHNESSLTHALMSQAGYMVGIAHELLFKHNEKDILTVSEKIGIGVIKIKP